MNHQNYLPYEITSDFCEAEDKIAEILMTYTKNRKQEPHPLYYKALAGAVKQMFVKLEESLVDESFGDSDDVGELCGLSLDVRDLDQLGIASYIEAKMLAPVLGEYLSSLQPYGEKIAIKYGFFEEEPNELHAVTALLEKADGHPLTFQSRPSYDQTEKYAHFIIDQLNRKMAETTSWNPTVAEQFFDELIQLQPAWAMNYKWNITALDLYEWFCLKNNLTFYQFPSLYTGRMSVNYRIGAYALRYPSEQNKFPEILSCLQKYARENPGNRFLKNLENEDGIFIQTDVLEPAEKLAGLEMMYRGNESNRDYHEKMLEVLANMVTISHHHPFHVSPDEDELNALYHEICRNFGIDPVLKDEDINEYCWNKYRNGEYADEEDEEPEEYFDRHLQKWVREMDEDKAAWTVKTTLDVYADCLESGLTIDDVCKRVSLEYDVSDDVHRAELLTRLQKELAGAFEPKLTNHIAYAVFLRLVAEAYHETPAELFNLQISVARYVFNDSEYCSRLPDVPEHLQAVAACTRTIFPDDPLIANQLASKICSFAAGICEQESLNPVAHHYFLAGGIKHLLECARSACDTSGPIQRIARLHGYKGDHIYATDLAVIDTLYRAVCTGYMKQPCIDIERIV